MDVPADHGSGITAALATGAAAYVGYIVPLGPSGARLVAIGAVGIFAVIHIIGVGPGSRVLIGLTVVKVVLIAALVGLAMASTIGGWRHFIPFVDLPAGCAAAWGALAGAYVAAFFSFGGWWEVTKVGGEVYDPSRTLPRALWLGLASVTLIYLFATAAFIYVIPIEQIRSGDAFIAQLGEALLGASGGVAIALVVLTCVLGSLGAILMFAPRLYFAMAADGLFPAAAAAIHPAFGTLARAIGIQATLASVLIVLGTFDTIVAYFVFITVVFIALTVASVFVLRQRDPGFVVPGHPWTALVFLATVAVLLVLLALNNPLQAALGVVIARPACRPIG